jgi:hypothetical protein
VADETGEEKARELHLEIIEVLKLLNRVEEEHEGVDGFEREELLHLMPRAGFPNATLDDVERTLKVLLANGYASAIEGQQYAWDRGRMVGERFTITLEGKRLLMKEIERVGRV